MGQHTAEVSTKRKNGFLYVALALTALAVVLAVRDLRDGVLWYDLRVAGMDASFLLALRFAVRAG